ncbi:unnamed protein product, partial [Brenthis ino]
MLEVALSFLQKNVLPESIQYYTVQEWRNLHVIILLCTVNSVLAAYQIASAIHLMLEIPILTDVYLRLNVKLKNK